MNCLRLVSCLLAVGVLLTGCKNKKAEENLATKKLLAQYCADFIPESALDMNPQSTFFLSTPEAMAILICEGESKNSEIWQKIFDVEPLFKYDKPSTLPWNAKFQSRDQYVQYETAARNVPMTKRGKALEFLDRPFKRLEHIIPLSEIFTYMAPELPLLRNFSLAAGADFIENGLKKNESGMLAVDLRLRNLREVAGDGDVLHILTGCVIEAVRLQYWSWAITEDLLSDQMLKDKMFLEHLPNYREQQIRTLYCLELEKEALLAFYTSSPPGTTSTWKNFALNSIPSEINPKETLVVELTKFRSELAEIVAIIADTTLSDSEAWTTITTKFAHLNALPSTSMSFSAYHEIKVCNSIYRMKSFAKLTSLACDIARYRKDNGKLPTSLNDLVPTYCSELPKNHLDTLPELVAGVSNEGRKEVYLQYPSDRNPNHRRIVFDPNR